VSIEQRRCNIAERVWFSEKDEELQERDEFRKDRAKERQRERNIARAAPDKRFSCMLLTLSHSYGAIDPLLFGMSNSGLLWVIYGVSVQFFLMDSSLRGQFSK